VAPVFEPLIKLLNLRPQRRTLPPKTWSARHRAFLCLLWLHILGLAIFASARRLPAGQGVAELGVLTALAVIGGIAPRRRLRAVAVALGLLASSALVVRLTGGLTASHFHFFVIVPLLTLYSDWLIFVLGIVFVVVHNGFLGTTDPRAVFDHPAAWSAPWKWALIHGVYIAAASATALVAWRVSEDRMMRDSLTQLGNAALYVERANQALARASRQGQRIALLSLDLDGFKDVNDTLGHDAGDQLLVEVGCRLKETLRESDTAARLGGDEFGILLEDVEGISAAKRAAARLGASLREPFVVSDHHVPVSASIGVALHEPANDDKTAKQLLKEADVALYAAKEAGKDTVRFSSDPVGH
jgi:diguanylate cyclase (GGDEF)-like protein